MSLNTPADVLAGRLAALSADQRDKVREAWRDRGDEAVLSSEADAAAEGWLAAESLPADGNAVGWQPRDELVVQAGLDRLLALVHPDVGHPDEARLSRAVMSELAQRYLRSGYWHSAENILLLPRRATTKGLRYPAEGPGPLAHTCAVLGEGAQAVEVIRVPQTHELDDLSRQPWGATDCAVAPLVGAEVLGLDFARRDGHWTYGPQLQDAALEPSVLERILDRADAAGAAILVLPEYCSSPTQRRRWTEVLKTRPHGSVRWLLIGSGPERAADQNVATLLSRDTQIILNQSKVQLFDLPPGALEDWGCPNIPEEARGQPMTERAHVSHTWTLLECNRGRLAVAVCESLRTRAISRAITPLAEALPTLLLCPVFSQPPRETCWERSASETWGELGVETLIANSLVVAQWQADGGELDPNVTCAATRPLVDTGKGHTWLVYGIEGHVDVDVIESIIHIGTQVPVTR